MNGKDKCKILKEIRAEIARNNDIEWVVSECRHQGDCLGTCPKCEAELRKLEKELEIKRNLGHAVTVAGLSVMLAGCSVFESILPSNDGGDVINHPDPDIEVVGEVPEPLDGDVEMIDPYEEEEETPVENTESAEEEVNE